MCFLEVSINKIVFLILARKIETRGAMRSQSRNTKFDPLLFYYICDFIPSTR